MIIRDLGVTEVNDSYITQAVVEWEDNEFQPTAISFEVRDRQSARDVPIAHGFLCACFPLAALHGERRIRLSEPACPMGKLGRHSPDGAGN